MDFFCTAEPAPPVAAVYGAYLTGKLNIATADWLRAVGQMPDLWKQTMPFTAASALPAPPADKGAKPKSGAVPAAATIESACLERAAAILQV